MDLQRQCLISHSKMGKVCLLAFFYFISADFCWCRKVCSLFVWLFSDLPCQLATLAIKPAWSAESGYGLIGY